MIERGRDESPEKGKVDDDFYGNAHFSLWLLDPHQPPLMLLLHSPKPTYPLKLSQSLLLCKPCELESHNFQLKSYLCYLLILTMSFLRVPVYYNLFVAVVQLLSHGWLFETPWMQHARLPCPSPPPGVCSNPCPLNQWCHPIILSSVIPFSSPSIFLSIRVISNESALCIQWPKYWSFSFSISPSSEYSGLISLRTEWLDLLAVQGTLKNLLQHHSPKASILWCAAFCM